MHECTSCMYLCMHVLKTQNKTRVGTDNNTTKLNNNNSNTLKAACCKHISIPSYFPSFIVISSFVPFPLLATRTLYSMTSTLHGKHTFWAIVAVLASIILPKRMLNLGWSLIKTYDVMKK